jgi:hypothetical protein
MAAGSYPLLREVKATQFVQMLSTAEIALGTALLVPVVPAALAGAGLLAFSAAWWASTCARRACVNREACGRLIRASRWPRTCG